MSKKIEQIQKLNPNFKIYDVNSSEFERYGRILHLHCKKSLIEKLDRDSILPEEGNIYKPFIREWEDQDIIDELSQFYAGQVEIGYCNGQNTKLNAMEWHNCNEINVFSTDALLFLAKLDDLEEYHLDSSLVKAFFIEKGTALIVGKDTLHFSPCKIDEKGFRAIIVLGDLTNTELDEEDLAIKEKAASVVDSLLFKTNKYIICHKEADNLIKQGVKPYITGVNFDLNI